MIGVTIVWYLSIALIVSFNKYLLTIQTDLVRKQLTKLFIHSSFEDQHCGMKWPFPCCRTILSGLMAHSVQAIGMIWKSFKVPSLLSLSQEKESKQTTYMLAKPQLGNKNRSADSIRFNNSKVDPWCSSEVIGLCALKLQSVVKCRPVLSVCLG